VGKDITAQIAGEADNSVLGADNVRGPQSDEKGSYLEVDLAPLAVRNTSLVQDLQQDHRDILHHMIVNGRQRALR
jgi:hypothetical protein